MIIANSVVATMVDGFPMAQNGETSRTFICCNNIINFKWIILWFINIFIFTILYKHCNVHIFLELWALVVLAFVTVGFVSTKNYVRSIIAIVLGVTLGLVGVDANNVPRFTLGWQYLEDGIRYSLLQVYLLCQNYIQVEKIVQPTK